mgnify:FL=1
MTTLAMPTFAVLRFDGADAQDFLNRQLTADIANLGESDCVQAGFCMPDGRLIATPIFCWIDGQLHAVLPDDLVRKVQQRLQLFVMRDDLQISMTSLAASLVTDVKHPAAGSVERTPEATMLGLQGDAPRTLSISASEPGPETHWPTTAIASGAPQVYAATSGLFLPQSLRMDTLGGVNFRKGCYPGQEVVARLHYRGQLKRVLVRADIKSGSCSPGDAVLLDEKAVGHVAEASAQAALVVAHLSALGQPVECASGALTLAAQPLGSGTGQA